APEGEVQAAEDDSALRPPPERHLHDGPHLVLVDRLRLVLRRRRDPDRLEGRLQSAYRPPVVTESRRRLPAARVGVAHPLLGPLSYLCRCRLVQRQSPLLQPLVGVPHPPDVTADRLRP